MVSTAHFTGEETEGKVNQEKNKDCIILLICGI